MLAMRLTTSAQPAEENLHPVQSAVVTGGLDPHTIADGTATLRIEARYVPVAGGLSHVDVVNGFRRSPEPVLSAIGPKLDGDVTVAVTAGTGEFGFTIEVDDIRQRSTRPL